MHMEIKKNKCFFWVILLAVYQAKKEDNHYYIYIYDEDDDDEVDVDKYPFHMI